MWLSVCVCQSVSVHLSIIPSSRVVSSSVGEGSGDGRDGGSGGVEGLVTAPASLLCLMDATFPLPLLPFHTFITLHQHYHKPPPASDETLLLLICMKSLKRS